ncbi:Photosynthetic NDH subunit of lumenal location 3 like [Heracleum sosnowskyi]|uniref:Photosynthetic NDH subunit of lumenal location 3 like n=1 Tax=Heracleum sosnowskyi TaxID=360622 RepID=A0AAD8MXE1_9APIA|nr:Photosynthetic NDH subunit of lumenal location 3 like [Heracleum sosnowskyi]
MEFKGSAIRIRRCACELLSIGDDLMDDEESWDLFSRDLHLKSTFLYCDFSKVISGAPQDQKKSLTKLGNRLFSLIEEFDYTVKIQSISQARSRFSDLALVLEEVVATDLMPPLMNSDD